MISSPSLCHFVNNESIFQNPKCSVLFASGCISQEQYFRGNQNDIMDLLPKIRLKIYETETLEFDFVRK